MTETESVSDVVFHQPQIITVETILPTANAGGAAGACGARTQSGAMELGRRLLLAARAGDTALVLDLMAKGAPFTNDWLGTSALHLAASNAHTETCGVLLRAGVSRESRTKVDRTPLHLAAYAGHADVAELLLQHGAQVDCRDMLRMTPLHWAAERGHTACCAALLRHGAEIKPVNKFRKTPQQLAAAKGHRDVLALIEEELKLREAAKSVRAIVPDRTAEETAATEVQRPVFTAVQRPIQEVKLKPKSVQEKSTKSESKTEKAESSSEQADGTSGSGAAAALLRRHGITLLPHDDSSTVLSAIQSGRTVVLSDAGKLMLKESSEPPSPPASAASSVASSAAAKPSRGMLLTATPVSSTPHGVKVFTVNNRLSVTPSEVKPRAKIMTPQDLQKLKIVQLPPDARIVSPRKAKKLRGTGAPPRTPVKIIMNKSNFQRLVAAAAPPAPPAAPAQAQTTPAGAQDSQESPTAGGAALEPAVEVTLLRSLLAQAHKTIAALTDELDAARAKLAQYEQVE